MTNAELIKALRHCGKGGDIAERCLPCDYYDREPWCEAALVNDAADAIEAAEKRIAVLEDELLPKSGKWLQLNGHKYCSRCGHKDSPILTHYCPNCGAKMKGANDGES